VVAGGSGAPLLFLHHPICCLADFPLASLLAGGVPPPPPAPTRVALIRMRFSVYSVCLMWVGHRGQWGTPPFLAPPGLLTSLFWLAMCRPPAPAPCGYHSYVFLFIL
jgi:hypothetical protein